MNTVRRRQLLRVVAGFMVLAIGISACSTSPALVQPITPNAFPEGLFDPTDVRGVELPEGYFRSWGRDRIAPVYEPTYVDATVVDWPDDELVIGVNVNDQQLAFPVGFMSNRELVIDQIDDIPLLITW